MATLACVVFRYAGVIADMIMLNVLYAQYGNSFTVSVDENPVARIQKLVVKLPMYL